jgi:hypothetical protein
MWRDHGWRDKAAWRSCAVQRVKGVSNRRIKGDALEPAPSLPPLKLSREGTLFPFTTHRRRRRLLL